MFRKSSLRHLVFPAVAPALLVCLYFTPKELFGCRNRGIMALVVVGVALLAAMVSMAKGVSEHRRGNCESAALWMVTTLILLSPLLLLVGPLG